MIGAPPSGDAWLARLASIVREGLARREALILGSRLSGTTWTVRFLATLASPLVQVHVQSTAAGEGGIAVYDPVNFTSSAEVDCRSERLQDVAITVTGGNDYVVFIVPKQVADDGTKILYDGQSSRPDSITFAMVSA